MQASKREHGLLIALEGIDGSGTSTQAELLVRRLNQSRAGSPAGCGYLTREPSSGVVGQLLRRVLSGEHDLTSSTVALLFAADRLDHYHVEVEPQVCQGVHVVSDRYVYSSLAYQSVQDAEQWVFGINAHAPSPDLAIYLRVSAQTAAARRAQRGSKEELFDADSLQRLIAGRYDDLLGASAADATWQLDGQRGWCCTGRRRTAFGRSAESAMIDGEQSVETIHEQLWSLLGAKLQQDGAAAKENKAT